MQIRKEYFGRLKDFTSKIISPNDYLMIENASPMEVFGEKRRGIGRVALAIKKENRILLIDGLDLNSLDPTGVIQTSARVVHTFWQYGRTPKPYGEILTELQLSSMVGRRKLPTSGMLMRLHSINSKKVPMKRLRRPPEVELKVSRVF